MTQKNDVCTYTAARCLDFSLASGIWQSQIRMANVPPNSTFKRLQLPNPYLASLEEDNLFHLNISTTSHDLPAVFGDVKFLCLGGSSSRMEQFANFIGRELGVISANESLPNLAPKTDRYVLYKAGPVLSANHGIGVPSMSVVLHELLKLLYHAGCSDVTFIRIGTSGGIGVPVGAVIVSEAVVNGKHEQEYEVVVLGRSVRRPIVVDQGLAQEICSCSRADDKFQTFLGKTYCTDDFYEGQARTHGAVCDITEDDESAFIETLHRAGVSNIEMESAGFIALCHKAGVKCAVLCVTLIDRLSVEDVQLDVQARTDLELRPQILVARFIKKRLDISGE